MRTGFNATVGVLVPVTIVLAVVTTPVPWRPEGTSEVATVRPVATAPPFGEAGA